MATENARVPLPVLERAQEIKDEYGYPTIGEGIRHMCQNAEAYDV